MCKKTSDLAEDGFPKANISLFEKCFAITAANEGGVDGGPTESSEELPEA